MANKATQAIKTKRINDIVKLMIGGKDRGFMLQYASENWDIGERSTDDYIRDAKEYFEKITADTTTEAFGMALTRLNDLYGRCLKAHQYHTCLQVQRELNELLGVKAAVKVDLTTKGEKITGFEYVEPSEQNLKKA